MAKEGRAEKLFQKHLDSYFPNKIYANLTCQNSNYGRDYKYTPDAVYIDRSTGLYIDIEVDEPYTFSEEKAIHYYNCHTDCRRNDFFLERGWIVIRFSEQQVVCCPDSCCKTLAQTIAEITGENRS